MPRAYFRRRLLYSTLTTILLSANAFAQFQENEGPNGNSDRTTANVFSSLTAGATITGNSQGSGTGPTNATATSADYFNLTPQTAPLGIYRHSISLSNTGHAGTIRGQSVTGSTVTLADTFVQTDSADTNVWYGFGRGETVNYRVTGTTSTTSNYTITYNAPTLITPTNLNATTGALGAGILSFSTVGFSLNAANAQIDTTIYILDANFNVLYRNDNEAAPGTTSGSILSRNFTPGVYYFAIGDTGTFTNFAPESADRQQNSKVTSSAIFVNDNSLTNRNLDFQVQSAGRTILIDNTKVNVNDINFYRFTVSAVPEANTGAFVMVGIALFAVYWLGRRFGIRGCRSSGG
jgi:hypothetical protein